MKEIQQLIEISQFYGRDNRFVIAGGGNTSYKNNEKIWVKASGSSLATITEAGRTVVEQALSTYANEVRTNFLGPLTRPQIVAMASTCRQITDGLKRPKR